MYEIRSKQSLCQKIMVKIFLIKKFRIKNIFLKIYFKTYYSKFFFVFPEAIWQTRVR